MGVDRPRILLVGGDEDLRSSLASLLKSAGYQVDCAAQKWETFTRVQQAEYDLIFLDLLLSDRRELEIISEIINLRPDADIFVLSGDNDIETKAQALQAGARGYLTKPVEPPEIIQDIQKILRDRHREEP